MTAKPTRNTYWDRVATRYQQHTRIATTDFHYGPLLPGDRLLRLLPQRLQGIRCLEVGCGAGQNSIYLARQGANCTAIDSSQRQIGIGQRLAHRSRMNIDYRVQTMESLPDKTLGTFDLVHSVHALAFAADAGIALKGMAQMLKPGGILLLATMHPLAATEPVRTGHRRMGVLISDYFHPEPDVRGGRGGWPEICATTLPFAELVNTLLATGCRVERIEEPQPPPIPAMSESAIKRAIPYESRAWRERYSLLAVIPFTMIICARKPLNRTMSSE